MNNRSVHLSILGLIGTCSKCSNVHLWASQATAQHGSREAFIAFHERPHDMQARNQNAYQQRQQQQAYQRAKEREIEKKKNKFIERITDECFISCVNNFSNDKLDAREELCVHRCCEKYASLSFRLSSNFTSYHAKKKDKEPTVHPE